jgi:hypothetical protein
VDEVQHWLDRVVVGLNLCPFAAEPNRKGQIKIYVSTARTEEALLTDLQTELRELDRRSPTDLETTLLVVPYMLQDFEAYNTFLALVDALLQTFGWEGEYQVASFHPNYCFADTEPDDPENLTNRSPYPILHILREASISKALDAYADPDQIPAKNIQTVQHLSPEQQRSLFPHLFGNENYIT